MFGKNSAASQTCMAAVVGMVSRIGFTIKSYHRNQLGYQCVSRYTFEIPYIANCSRLKSFVGVQLNFNLLENIYGPMATW